jgi:mannose-1-phosphate guanylyltransferase
VAPVLKFHEKPKLPKARRYVAAGNYFWNSGMFFWRTDVLLDELRRHLPKTATVLAALPPFGGRKFDRAFQSAFPLCDNISIDYAVLEKSKKVSGIPAADFGWNDVGSWNAVYELLPRDVCGNVIARDSVCLDARNNFVDARGKTVALLGVEDLIVVDTPDALLVASRSRAQQVGDIVKALEKQQRHELL